MSKRVLFRTDLICLCPKHCAKAFELSLEPWSMRRAVWREIGSENIKKRLRKIMFRIHVTDSINQIFDDEMVYITKTNPITKNQKCNRFISYNWARVLRRRNAYILELVNVVCSFFFDREIYGNLFYITLPRKNLLCPINWGAYLNENRFKLIIGTHGHWKNQKISMANVANYSFELISIETYTPQFIGHNKLFLGGSVCGELSLFCVISRVRLFYQSKLP